MSKVLLSKYFNKLLTEKQYTAADESINKDRKVSNLDSS